MYAAGVGPIAAARWDCACRFVAGNHRRLLPGGTITRPSGGRTRAATSSRAAQDQPPGAPALLDPPQVQPLPLPSAGPSASVIGAGDASGPCDFWIVSSRNCNGKIAPRDAGCCLSFYHRTSDQCLVPRGREAFMASLRPDWPICFVIHGSYNYWHDVVSESQLINRWVHAAAPNQPVQFVYFTWPSNGYMPFILPVDLAVLGRRSSAHGAYLANLITQLPPEQPVSIVGHSHGARTAAAALHVLGGGTLENGQALPCGFSVPQHLRAVLIAAAIDHNWLNPCQRYGQKCDRCRPNGCCCCKIGATQRWEFTPCGSARDNGPWESAGWGPTIDLPSARWERRWSSSMSVDSPPGIIVSIITTSGQDLGASS